jgi:hypothetical protein
VDQTPNKSKSDQPKPNRRKITTHLVTGIAGGVVVALYFTKYRKTLTCINISPEMVERAKDGGELLGFGTPRNMTVVSLTRNV